MMGFWACRQGNVAIVFALSLIPIVGAAGVAVDYARASNAKSFAQGQADRAALFGIQVGPEGDTSRYIEDFKRAMRDRYGDVAWVNGMDVQGVWVSEVDFRVEARGNVPVTLLAAVPGMSDNVPIGVVAAARLAEPKYVYNPPEVSELDPEADDYNRIYVYCFDAEEKDDPETRGRTQMTAIADNGDDSEYEFTMPRCEAGETLSFRLINVREARTRPELWDNGGPRFEYYTDTVINDNGAEQYDISCEGDNNACSNPPAGGWEILETVLCNSPDECKPKSQGGIIPEGKDRTPQRATQACSPGKYIYYGWEDRPPGTGWTDRDYDDIRIVIGCPSMEQEGERNVRLTR